MSAYLRRLEKRIERLRAGMARKRDYSVYRDKPAAYAREVLGVTLTPRQIEIAEAVMKPPYRVLVPSGHDVGKTFAGAVLVCWWFDTRNPSVCLTTAPKLDQVKDLLWKEIRSLRSGGRLGGFTGPKSLRLEDGPKHFAKGVTANTQAGFQGQHEKNVLILIDEAEGVDREYIEAAKTMATGEGHAIVCFYNPYTTSSHVAFEEKAVDREGRSSWTILPMSSLDHPNIKAELVGAPPPMPQAVRIEKVDAWVKDWCRPIDAGERKLTDIEWRPGSCQWWRPGPRFEAGVLGRRPSTAVNSVWSDAVVEFACKQVLPVCGPVQIGVDCARFGDDDTAIHLRQGGVSLHHESHNGLNTIQIATRVAAVAMEWGEKCGVSFQDIVIAIDDAGGWGAGVVDRLHENHFRQVHPVNVCHEAPDEEKSPSLRSALWCDLADAAAKGWVSFAKLSQQTQWDLRRELTAPTYTLDAWGRRVVESKKDTKERLGRSPDNADAVLLAYCQVGALQDRIGGRVEVPG